MSTDLSAEFLADDLEPVAVNPVDAQHVRDVGGMQLDGKSRGQIDSEVNMRDQHNAASRNNGHQRFADEFSVGISKSFICDFPHFAVRSTEGLAYAIEFCTPAGNESGGC